MSNIVGFNAAKAPEEEYRKATQTVRVFKYMQQFGSINPMQALGDLGVMRLASRISDLKKQGVPIERKMVTKENRWGEPVTFAEYRLAV